MIKLTGTVSTFTYSSILSLMEPVGSGSFYITRDILQFTVEFTVSFILVTHYVLRHTYNSIPMEFRKQTLRHFLTVRFKINWYSVLGTEISTLID